MFAFILLCSVSICVFLDNFSITPIFWADLLFLFEFFLNRIYKITSNIHIHDSYRFKMRVNRNRYKIILIQKGKSKFFFTLLLQNLRLKTVVCAIVLILQCVYGQDDDGTREILSEEEMQAKLDQYQKEALPLCQARASARWDVATDVGNRGKEVQEVSAHEKI